MKFFKFLLPYLVFTFHAFNHVESGLLRRVVDWFQPPHSSPPANFHLPPVQNVRIGSITSSSIHLEWDASDPRYRTEIEYTVKYRDTGKNFSFCQHSSINGTDHAFTIRKTGTEIIGLEPFSNYYIEIYATRIDQWEKQSTIVPVHVTTKSIDEFTWEEWGEITITTYNVSATDITFVIGNVYCQKMKGQLTITIIISRINAIGNSQKNHTMVEPLKSLIFKFGQQLDPSTNYRFNAFLCRGKICTAEQVGHFTTISLTSEKPENLEVIIHENNTMEIFWRHPKQTNGDLTAFEIFIQKGLAANNTFIEATDIDMVQTKCSWTAYSSYCYVPLKREDHKLQYSIRLNETFPAAKWLIVSVMGKNKYRGSPAEKKISTYPPIPNLVHKSKSIFIRNSTNTSITIAFNITTEHHESILEKRYFFIFMNESNSTAKENENVKKLVKLFNISFAIGSNVRLVASNNLINYNNQKLYQFTIGSGSSIETSQLGIECDNRPLIQGQIYNITILIVNEFRKKYRSALYHIIGSTDKPSDKSSMSSGFILFWLLFLFLVFVAIGVLIIYRKRVVLMKSSLLKIDESVLFSTPNEDAITEDFEDWSILTDDVIINAKPETSVNLGTANSTRLNHKVHSKRVKIENFEEYVRKSMEDGELERQHGLLPRGPNYPCIIGARKENKAKNRYNNLIAYDHSRVKLSKVLGDENSDYINANYINGYKSDKAYIATQGPKSTTTSDFWRMIWQENVKFIVMLANIYENDKKRVEQYWPNRYEEITFGNIRVQYESKEIGSGFEYRIFNVMCEHETRKVEQLHFTLWPDHGIPLYPQTLVPTIQRMLKIPLSSSSPIVVHCSAGIGRSGTVLLIDICLRMAAEEKYIDMLNNLHKLREQRLNMVDNEEQYKLAHLVVLECLTDIHTNIPCDNDMKNAVEKLLKDEGCKKQMDYLRKIEWRDELIKTVAGSPEKILSFPEKNRIEVIIPDNQDRISLPIYPENDISSAYINAVVVDGFRCHGKFIVTQQPMPNTLADFWRLVVHKRSKIIVSLNEVDPNVQASCNFWPTSAEQVFHPVDFMNVTFEKVVTLKHYDIYSVQVFVQQEEEEMMSVKIFAFKTWRHKTDLPCSLEEFMSFQKVAESTSKSLRNIIVTCFDGVTASGVYVALSFITRKMKEERECDVCSAVRTVRHNRRQFIKNEEQFAFLCEAAVRFFETCQGGANSRRYIIS